MRAPRRHRDTRKPLHAPAPPRSLLTGTAQGHSRLPWFALAPRAYLQYALFPAPALMSDYSAVPLHNARIAWQENGLPLSEDYGDIYFSSAGGLAETEHVFLEGNDLARRWRDLQGGRFVIGECGFGSG